MWANLRRLMLHLESCCVTWTNKPRLQVFLNLHTAFCSFYLFVVSQNAPEQNHSKLKFVVVLSSMFLVSYFFLQNEFRSQISSLEKALESAKLQHVELQVS